MNWILTAILCVPLVEIALRLPFTATVAQAGASGAKAMRVVRSRAISDHWKEKAMAAYARRTFLASLKLAGLLAVLLGVAAILVLLFERVARGFPEFLLGWRGIGFSVVFASLYYAVRKSLVHGGV